MPVRRLSLRQLASQGGESENCQWQFARPPTLENWFFKDVAAGSRNVTKSLLPPKKDHPSEPLFCYDEHICQKNKSSLALINFIFKELFVGTLIYAVVLGFFNDYTNIVHASSFSVIFFASVILEFLTYCTILLKGVILGRFKTGQSKRHKALMLLCAWLVLFLSKFIFVGAIDFVFGEDIAIKGFFGVTGVVMSVTLAHKLAEKMFEKLGDS